MPERSVARRITSVTMPESIHDLAVIMPALPEAHMAETDMVGPWKSYSFISMRDDGRRHHVDPLRLARTRSAAVW